MERKRSKRRKHGYPRRSPGISVALQDLHIRGRFPTFTCRLNRGHSATWKGRIQPRETSPAYEVAIKYQIGMVPRVRVCWPPLHPRAPHVYGDGTLCLYWPEEWRWDRSTLIAETILPWTALWLYYYELWLDTGEWLGPSSLHGLRKGQENDVSGD